MVWHDLLPYLIFGVTFVASLLSGIASGGGGYIITPFLIAIGFTPQQSVSTVKLWALGMDSGSLYAYRKKSIKNNTLSLLLIFVAAAVGFASAIAIRHLPNQNLRLVMGVLSLITIPVLFIKHHEIKSRRRHFIFQGLGFVIIIGLMLAQGIFASGIGSLINVFLIAFFGLKVLEANLIKRRFSLVSDVVAIAGLATSGLINYKYGLIGAVAGLSGGYIGSKLAIKEGEKFARYALMAFMLVSGVWLITTS